MAAYIYYCCQTESYLPFEIRLSTGAQVYNNLLINQRITNICIPLGIKKEANDKIRTVFGMQMTQVESMQKMTTNHHIGFSIDSQSPVSYTFFIQLVQKIEIPVKKKISPV